MALTPEDIHNKEFTRAFRGYNELEVDAFLDELEIAVAAMVAEKTDLRDRLSAAASAPPPVAAPAAPSESEEMIRRTLLLAQRTSDETIGAAEAEASRLVAEAHEQATAVTQQAQAQGAQAVSDLERRKRELEAQIEGLRAFEREYRTRLKAYLETQLRDLDTRGGAPAPSGGPSPVAPSPVAGGSLFQPIGGAAAAPAEPSPATHDDVPGVAP